MAGDAGISGEIDVLLEGFRLRAEGLGVKVLRAPGSHEASRELVALAGEWGSRSPIITGQALEAFPVIADAMARAGVQAEQAISPDHCRDQAMGIGLGLAALAETGSVLVAEETLADRSVGMLTGALALLVPTASLLPGLDEAAPRLREIAQRGGGRFATLITGPSRTADIERVLTVGVQGPGKVAVLFLDDV